MLAAAVRSQRKRERVPPRSGRPLQNWRVKCGCSLQRREGRHTQDVNIWIWINALFLTWNWIWMPCSFRCVPICVFFVALAETSYKSSLPNMDILPGMACIICRAVSPEGGGQTTELSLQFYNLCDWVKHEMNHKETRSNTEEWTLEYNCFIKLFKLPVPKCYIAASRSTGAHNNVRVLNDSAKWLIFGFKY